MPTLEKLREVASKRTPGKWELLPMTRKYYGTEVQIPRKSDLKDFQCLHLWNEHGLSMPGDISKREIEEHGSVEQVISDHMGWNHCENRHDLGNAEFIAMASATYDKLLDIVEAAKNLESAVFIGYGYGELEEALKALEGEK